MFKPKLVSWNNIQIIDQSDENHFDFFIDDEKIDLTKISNNLFSFKYDGEILGKKLILRTLSTTEIVSTKECPQFIDFDEKYSYFNDDLGSTYYPNHTEFVLWAPLANKVILRIKDSFYQLKREEKGIFRLSLEGDFDGELYDYEVNVDGETIVATDPYGKSSNANSEKSAVINFNKIKTNCNYKLPEFNNYVEAIIYEVHVRDFTISPLSNIKNKGKFLGLSEVNKTSPNSNPVGIDYLKELQITHLQLLPVLDYITVNELNNDEYNWGYDPASFFTLEGSYSTNPNDPYSRLIEFKQMINALHKNGIRVNLDVVYNHVYKPKQFAAHKITPNYFTRFEGDKISDRSWCGNDFASERIMARKMIIDSLTYLLKEFDVDGFRFDLMGLIDVETIKEAEQKIHNIKKDAMIYGEGWDMFANSKFADKFATIKNQHLLNNVAFFNDSYRNILRGIGNNAKLDENGFLLGNSAYNDGFQFAYFAGTKDIVFPHLFESYSQSINYVECHDNATIFDVISNSSNESNIDGMIKLFNKILLLSPGIPFFHMGQEIGQSKYGKSNTYNLGDLYNQFDVKLMDEKIDLVKSFRNYINIRKSIDIFKKGDKETVNQIIKVDNKNLFYEISMNNIYILINKDANFLDLSDLKYKKMELYYPNKERDKSENITAYNLGLGSRKCSIFIDLDWELKNE